MNGRYKEEYDLIYTYDFEDSRVFEEAFVEKIESSNKGSFFCAKQTVHIMKQVTERRLLWTK